MVLYTNYKQVAKITLKSDFGAVKDTVGTTIGFKTSGTGVQTSTNVDIVSKYTYSITLPNMQFNKNTRLAVDKFSIQLRKRDSGNHLKMDTIPDVYIKNIHQKNVFNSRGKSSYGTCILSIPFNILQIKNDEKPPPITYQNPDLINNSIDITGKTAFLQGQPLEIFIDTHMTKYKQDPPGTHIEDGFVEGCPDTFIWSLSLIVYEEEKEENAKDFVDDRAKIFGIPKLY